MIVVIAGAIVVAVLIAILYAQIEKDRTTLLGSIATELGLQFAPEKDRDFPNRFRQFEVFARGHTRSAFNTMAGSMSVLGRDARLQTGDYRYSITRSTGKSTSTQVYRLSYAIVVMPLEVPDVTIRPEGFLDAIAQAIGFDDIDFEDAEFSRMFMVKSHDKRFAYDLCHPRMIEHLKAGYARGPAILISRGALCVFTENRRWEPSEFGPRIDALRAFFAMWPDHLVRDLQSAARGGSR